MKCAKCGNQMRQTATTLTATVRDEQFEVAVTAPQCVSCGRVVLDAAARQAYHRTGSEAYRRQHDLLTMEELETRRKALGMMLPEFADWLSIGIATLKRWRGGEIQSESLDQLVRLKTDATDG